MWRWLMEWLLLASIPLIVLGFALK
ncbi:DUF969 domain-containing protein, partial [Campylobacter jejuni]|nr:DUF969 domain-containing protein [Campylobacter jejuni]